MRLEPHAKCDARRNCRGCKRLAGFVRSQRKTHPDWFNAPVPTWVPVAGDNSVSTLIVGLAPGLKGANRTGVPFTGDSAGDTLFAALKEARLAHGTFTPDPNTSMQLLNCAITNAVRCVPPKNRPTGEEVNTCTGRYLTRTVARFKNLERIITLGKIAHDATVRSLGAGISEHRFAHNARTRLGAIKLVASYHCSRYNMNTGRLTFEMLSDVFR